LYLAKQRGRDRLMTDADVGADSAEPSPAPLAGIALAEPAV
jgi:hypothetical protein